MGGFSFVLGVGIFKVMTKRFRIMGASALAVIGISILVGGFNPSLNAAGVADTGIDLGRYLVWGGVGALVVSALLFLSASAE
jgi:hypothetical protein